MPTKPFLILLLGCLSFIATAQTAGDQPFWGTNPVYLEADSLLEIGLVPEGLDVFKDALDMNAAAVQNIPVWIGLAKAYYFIKGGPTYIEDFQKSHQYAVLARNAIHESGEKLSPNLLAELHYYEGLYFEEGPEKMLDSALYHYGQALQNRKLHYGEYHPKVAACYDGLANSYRYVDFNFNEANKNYLISIEVREKSAIKDNRATFLTYYWYLGTLFMNKKLFGITIHDSDL